MKIVIYPFPATDKNNPFLDLFYAEVNLKFRPGFNFEVKKRSLSQLLKEAPDGKQQKNIIHMHWSVQLYGSRFIPKSLYLMVVNFYRLFVLKKKHAFKIVWTMHNYKSHDYPYPLVDWIGRKILFYLADCIIIQQEATQKVLANKYKEKHIIFIPLGNYISIYGEASKSRSEMRKEFCFSDNDLVLLSFGTVRPYKKNDEVIKIFKRNENDISSKIKLVIIGSATDAHARYIGTLINRDRQIIFRNRFAKDSEVADLFQMVDYSIFWFDDSVLTSSGVVLSLSYGVPVIARNIPAAEMVRDPQNGFLFDNAAGLLKVLKVLPNIEKPNKERVINAVIGNTWPAVAEKFMSMCIEL